MSEELNEPLPSGSPTLILYLHSPEQTHYPTILKKLQMAKLTLLKEKKQNNTRTNIKILVTSPKLITYRSVYISIQIIIHIAIASRYYETRISKSDKKYHLHPTNSRVQIWQTLPTPIRATISPQNPFHRCESRLVTLSRRINRIPPSQMELFVSPETFDRRFIAPGRGGALPTPSSRVMDRDEQNSARERRAQLD